MALTNTILAPFLFLFNSFSLSFLYTKQKNFTPSDFISIFRKSVSSKFAPLTLKKPHDTGIYRPSKSPIFVWSYCHIIKKRKESRKPGALFLWFWFCLRASTTQKPTPQNAPKSKNIHNTGTGAGGASPPAQKAQ